MNTHSLQEEAPGILPVPKDTMNTPREIMKVLHEVGHLKRLLRSGWQVKKIPNPESVAEHSFRLSIMTFFAPDDLDRTRLMEMALVHDLGETVAGDYTPHDKIPKGKASSPKLWIKAKD
ncbi:HD domain-containing protein 2 [Lachnellula arida]|uniref:HD domain-containing protein 2 n=1 Tax=Lachnellula arida TaxID=1316785 RepID=A0A8T9AXS6_9HELO|nr:HD domain-containing protein 2 [Lachnellula arida]